MTCLRLIDLDFAVGTEVRFPGCGGTRSGGSYSNCKSADEKGGSTWSYAVRTTKHSNRASGQRLTFTTLLPRGLSVTIPPGNNAETMTGENMTVGPKTNSASVTQNRSWS